MPFIHGRFCQGDSFELCLYIDIIPTCWSWRQDGYAITFIFRKQKYLQIGLCVCVYVFVCVCECASMHIHADYKEHKVSSYFLETGSFWIGSSPFCLSWMHSKLSGSTHFYLQNWGYTHAQSHTAFFVGTVCLTQVLMLAQQVLVPIEPSFPSLGLLSW